VNQQPPENQQPNEQPGEQFKSPPIEPESPPQQEKRTLWQRYRTVPLKVRIATGFGLLLVILLLFSSGGVVIYRLVKLSPTPSSSIPGQGKIATFPAHSNLTPQHTSFPPTAIAVDFSLRENHTHAIANNMIGLNGFNKIRNNSQLLNYLGPAHINLVRVGVDMVATFPTAASVNPQQQNWKQFDSIMTAIQAQGLQPILTIAYTPTWLQPQNNPCTVGVSSHVSPTYIQNGTDIGPNQWGILAAQVVAHMDQKYPNVHPAYEIWNEPDGTTFLCVAASDPNPDQTRLTEYKAIYAAAAARMKQQAQQDQTLIRIGGPALAVPRTRASTWLPALLNDPGIAPYIDFISYHYYHAGSPGDTWNSLLAQTRDPVNGVAEIFEHVSAIVRSGKQPNPQSTPIFIDEYNTNTHLPDCCRNNRTFGSLWNALFVADLLNSVNDTRSPYGPAQASVGGLAYFAATEPPPGNEFCLFGTWDSAMDCAMNGSIQPYPQYYAYQLLSDPRFLDITDNGYITGAPLVQPPGLVVASFYTNTKDSVLIVNTSGTSYPQLTVGLKNPGTVQSSTTPVYTLNQNSPQIGINQITMLKETSGYIATVSVPAYSTVAVSLTAGN
jgi:Glycosyl hydrolases family 39